MLNQSERTRNNVHGGTCGCCTGLKKALVRLLRRCRKIFKRNTNTTIRQEDDLNDWVIIEKVSLGDWQEVQLPLILSEEREEHQGCSTEAQPLVLATERCNPAPPSLNLEEPVIEVEQQQDSCMQLAHHQDGDSAQWTIVCNKKTKKMKNKPPMKSVSVTAKAVAGKGKDKGKGKRHHHTSTTPSNKCRTLVAQSWLEDTVEVVLQVLPNMRRHVIGARGQTLQRLRQEYPSVRVSVPPPQDTVSREVVLKGFKSEVCAAAKDLTCHLQDVEKERRQAQVCQVVLEVAPSMRCHVVGFRGEALTKLAQEHPSVRVTVPFPTDTKTGTITIRGPPAEVSAVKDSIAARLQVVQQRQQRLARGRTPPGKVTA